MLEELFTRYGTNKGEWGYTEAYEQYLNDRRASVRSVLEIGIYNFGGRPGASLYVWRDFFPTAQIFGLDNDPQFIFSDERITTRLCDAYNPKQLMETVTDTQFDFIVDDAVHDPLNQMALCLMLWPNLTPGGVYAIEEACPYKVADHDLGHIIYPMMRAYQDMAVREITTHKEERLLILTKDAKRR